MVPKNIFYVRACSLAYRRDSVEKHKKERAAICVVLLIKAIYLAQMTPFALCKKEEGETNGA